MAKGPFAAALESAMRDLEETELPVILPLKVLEHLVTLVELSHEGLFDDEERRSLAYAKAQVEKTRLLASGRKPS